MGKTVKEIPIKAHNSITYKIIRNKSDAKLEVTLQLTVKAVNNTTRLDSLVPTLLVFGVYPRISDNSPPSPLTLQRSKAVKKAIDKQEKNGWEGPFTLLANDGTTCTVKLPQGPRNFCITVVKLYHQEGQDANSTTTKNTQAEDHVLVRPTPDEESAPTKETREAIVVAREQPPRRKLKIATTKSIVASAFTAKEDTNYALAVDLHKKGVIITPSKPFKLYNEKKHSGIYIFKLRLVCEVKGYADDDITQAYTQSTTLLNRVILACLPMEIRHLYPRDSIMVVKRPLYGILEVGTHWWIDTLTFDLCLLISSANNDNFALISMQTNDTIGLTDKPFSKRENVELEKATFTAKPKQFLETDKPITFNGGVLSLHANGEITLCQKGQGKRLQPVDAESPQAKQQYIKQRACGAYIASICQPEACFDYSVAAQHQSPEKGEIKELNRRLRFQPLDLTTAKLYVFVDGLFANNSDLTSQLGFIVILANEQSNNNEPTEQTPGDTGSFTVNGNIVHFSSTKCKRVTRSVLASEIYAMVAGADIAYVISTTLAMITDRLGYPRILTVIYTDLYSLYECLVKLSTTKEKRLMINIMALRDNPADRFTKTSPNKALEELVSRGRVDIQMNG
ncbi:hypothetical protein LX36DRAFT_695501 [Colletotrichum falcatum]|nr:hypothetical protein LX36DRAFT_695501 [Colletotrichum falcatum]